MVKFTFKITLSNWKSDLIRMTYTMYIWYYIIYISTLFKQVLMSLHSCLLCIHFKGSTRLLALPPVSIKTVISMNESVQSCSVYCVLFSLRRSFLMTRVTGISISWMLRGLLALIKCSPTPPRWSSVQSACPSLSRPTRTTTNQGRRWNFGLYWLHLKEIRTRVRSIFLSGWVSAVFGN